MSKKFSKQIQIQNEMVVPNTLNSNPSQLINEINGKLDSQNIPVNSIAESSFSAPVEEDTGTVTEDKFKWTGASQTYYEVNRTQLAHGSAINWFNRITSFDLKTEDWNKGWNKVEELNANFERLFIFDQMKEGMLTGCARVNFRHGINVVQYGSDPVISARTGFDWWTRWGVFVNDVLIAESGKVYPRGENLVIPFSVPVGSQQIRIDIRWKTWTNNAIETGDPPLYTGDPTTDLEIWGVGLWARNQYR